MGLTVLQPRECGACDACCVHLEVTEKPAEHKAGERCRWHAGASCGIYASRPRTCSDFECLWIRGAWTDDERPDRLGVMYHEIDDPRSPLGGSICVTELREGAVDALPDDMKPGELGFTYSVILVRADGKREGFVPMSLKPGERQTKIPIPAAKR